MALKYLTKSVAALLRQVMGERPGLGVVGGGQRGLEQERLGLDDRALAGNLDRVNVGAVDLVARAGRRAREASPCAGN